MYSPNEEQLRERHRRRHCRSQSPVSQSPNASKWMADATSSSASTGRPPYRVNQDSTSGTGTKKHIIYHWDEFKQRMSPGPSGPVGGPANGGAGQASSTLPVRIPRRGEDSTDHSCPSGVDIQSHGTTETAGDFSDVRSYSYSYASSAATPVTTATAPEPPTAAPAPTAKERFRFRATVVAFLAAILTCLTRSGHSGTRTRKVMQESPAPSSVIVAAADYDVPNRHPAVDAAVPPRNHEEASPVTSSAFSSTGYATPGNGSRRSTGSWSAFRTWRVRQSPGPSTGSITPIHEIGGRVAIGKDSPSKQSSVSQQQERMSFTIDDVKRATGDFSFSSVIGEGGYGTVYKGELPDGTLVAIKRARKGRFNEHVTAEFLSEISILAQITHLNLVRYLGYVEDGDERIIVVEYVSNGTLREHLDGKYQILDFGDRLSIAVDIAHAVAYLHNHAGHPIIHRDIKSANILLTKNLRAKVADFGFARIGGLDASFVITQVKGTTGYLDPEYLNTLQLTKKSDVYSFGVLLVELVSGRRPIERGNGMERTTMNWAIGKFRAGQSADVLDPCLPKTPAACNAVERILDLASRCLARTKQSRPNMQNCGKTLCFIRSDYLADVRKVNHNCSTQSSDR